MSTTLIMIIEILGGIILLVALGYTFARISGYGEHYDKKLYDEESDAYITIKKNNKENNDDDIIHHVSI